MKEKDKNHISLVKEIWNQNTDNPIDSYEKNLKISKLKSIMDIISIGNYLTYIVNLHTGEIEYISPSVEELLGFSPEEFSLDLYINLIHPEDLPHLIGIQKKVSEFTFNTAIEDRMLYKYCYDYRVKNKDGEYQQFYIQHFYPELSPNNNPQRAFSLLTDITHIKTGGTPQLNIFKLGEGLVKILKENQYTSIKLTTKETEIFEFLVKGYTSQDIANALEISKHTVDTHRRNILKRNNCSNTSELLSLYFENKLDIE